MLLQFKYCTSCGKEVFSHVEFVERLGETYCLECDPDAGGAANTLAAPTGLLNHSVPEVAAFYRRLATVGAYALPERVLSLLVWLGDTRGGGFEEARTALEAEQLIRSFWIWCKETLSAAEREGHVDQDAFTFYDFAWIVCHNPSLDFPQLIEKQCEYLRQGKITVASPDETQSAWARLTEDMTGWMVKNNIKFYKDPPNCHPGHGITAQLGSVLRQARHSLLAEHSTRQAGKRNRGMFHPRQRNNRSPS